MELRMTAGDKLRLHQRQERIEKEMKLYRFLLAITLILGGIIIWLS